MVIHPRLPRLLVVLLLALAAPAFPALAGAASGPARPVAQITETATPTATPDTAIYVPLTSGNTLVVQRQITFGDIAIAGALMGLLLILLVAAVYAVVNRWL